MNKYIPFYEDNQDTTKTTNFKKWFGNSKVIDRKEPFDDNIYLNDVHETMAFAWQLIDYYRLMKLSKEQMSIQNKRSARKSKTKKSTATIS